MDAGERARMRLAPVFPGLGWLLDHFVRYLLEAFSIQHISPETFSSSLKTTAERFVSSMGRTNAVLFADAVARAIQKEADDERNR